MDAHERYFARILFRNKVLESKGMDFERLFVEVMSSANADFRSPKPHGKEGDWKCDGYDSKTGQFYQVYAPEKPTERVTDAVAKLEDALEGMLEKWNEFMPVKEYFFVYNDAFQGIYPEIEKRLSELSQKHKLPCSLFLSRDLLRVFETLDDDAKAYCIQCPIPETTGSNKVVSYEALNEVVNYIVSLPYERHKPERIDLSPDFLKKIEFNALSQPVADLLKGGAHQIGALDRYFDMEPDLKVVLQQRFVALYEEGKQRIANNHRGYGDELFFYIFEKACPQEPKKFFGDAVEVLMSYYFECCDIFEPPKTTLFD
ncbi:MAG TPA: hypothetical protein PKA00_19420 [Saprospiraceae bacterium]|nr:hypothetical protein [Saprospiraceae bacterium]HMQ85089.1 hypothetical protein [Saprospiraceae bacterium]